MRILITNDDGISAPGLRAAEDIASELTGPDGEVWVVAPAFEQSGVSHCISYVRPMRLEQLGPKRYAVEGSPADCTLAGVCEVLKDTPPDLILSGVNRGYNVAQDTLYSGTIGGAMEGTLLGIRSIAMSQSYGPALAGVEDIFGASRDHATGIIRKLLASAEWTTETYNVFYNINFPALSSSEVRGVRATRQGWRPSPTFGVMPHRSPNGRDYLWITHGHGNADTAPGSDSRECYDGYATVTPLIADMTAQDLVGPLSSVLT